MNKTDEIVYKVNKMFFPHEVFLVGGAVRDSLLGIEPKDYDFSTAMCVDDIENIVRKAKRRPYVTGKRFGTIGFRLQTDDGEWQYIELTTFRKESYVPNSRKPQVEFIADLYEDLSRRDLTIGAIAYRNGSYIDPFNGRIDLAERKLKAVGNATDRYKEDPLRMLRLARFAAQLDFDVDTNLIGCIRKMAPKILMISRERWMQEMTKLLTQDRAICGIEVLMKSHLLRYILPEVWIVSNRWPHDLFNAVNSSPCAPEDRWAAILKYIGRPYVNIKETKSGRTTYPNQHLIAQELVKGIALRLKWSNDLREQVLERIAVIIDTD